MKVNSKDIIECFDQIRYILSGIVETVQWSEDGFQEAVESQSNDIVTIIRLFSAQHLTPKQQDTVKRHQFLDYKERSETWQENQQLVKARVYLWLKRQLKETELPYDLKENDAHNYIWSNIICGSGVAHWWDGEFQKTADQALYLVVKEAYEYRRKHAQLTMSLEVTKEETRTNWTDLIDLNDGYSL